jgi:hypothetical protein
MIFPAASRALLAGRPIRRASWAPGRQIISRRMLPEILREEFLGSALILATPTGRYHWMPHSRDEVATDWLEVVR